MLWGGQKKKKKEKKRKEKEPLTPPPPLTGKQLPEKTLPHQDPAETQDPLPDQAAQTQSLQAP